METLFGFPTTKPNFLPIVREADSFTLNMGHVGKYVKVTKATAAVVTMPLLPTAEPVEGIIEQYGAGAVSFSPVSGVSLRCDGYAATITLHGQYANAGWKWDPENREYTIFGYVTVT